MKKSFVLGVVLLLFQFSLPANAGLDSISSLSATSCAVILHPHSPLIDVMDLAKDRSVIPDNLGGIQYMTPWPTHSRRISLPPVLTEWHRQWQRDPKPVYALSALGNSGPRYADTWHNLGYRLLTMLAQDRRFQSRTLLKSSRVPSPSTEFMKIKYDSLIEREWEESFRTLMHDHRTQSGEVFLLENPDYRIVLVRPIGDYGDAGDFIVPVLRYLEIPSQNFLLLRDEPKAPLMSASHIEPTPVSPHGNRGLVSINQNLGLSMVSDISNVIIDFAIAKKLAFRFFPENYLRENLLQHSKPISQAKLENLIRDLLPQILEVRHTDGNSSNAEMEEILARIAPILKSHLSYHQLTLGTEAGRYLELGVITNQFDSRDLNDFNLSQLDRDISQPDFLNYLQDWEKEVWAILSSLVVP